MAVPKQQPHYAEGDNLPSSPQLEPMQLTVNSIAHNEKSRAKNGTLAKSSIAKQPNDACQEETIQGDSLRAIVKATVTSDESDPVDAKSLPTARYLCKTCGVVCKNWSHYKVHMRVHTGERPFECNECDAKFANKSHLVLHVRKHTGERPYMCGICGKCFTQSTHLKTHMKKHSDELPFTCKVCLKSFKHEQSLDIHVSSKHKQEYKYSCSCCDKLFVTKKQLTSHARVHEKKLYECNICNKKFKDPLYIAKHQASYCGNDGYKQRWKKSLPKKKKKIKSEIIVVSGVLDSSNKIRARGRPKGSINKKNKRWRKRRATIVHSDIDPLDLHENVPKPKKDSTSLTMTTEDSNASHRQSFEAIPTCKISENITDISTVKSAITATSSAQVKVHVAEKSSKNCNSHTVQQYNILRHQECVENFNNDSSQQYAYSSNRNHGIEQDSDAHLSCVSQVLSPLKKPKVFDIVDMSDKGENVTNVQSFFCSSLSHDTNSNTSVLHEQNTNNNQMSVSLLQNLHLNKSISQLQDSPTVQPTEISQQIGNTKREPMPSSTTNQQSNKPQPNVMQSSNNHEHSAFLNQNIARQFQDEASRDVLQSRLSLENDANSSSKANLASLAAIQHNDNPVSSFNQQQQRSLPLMYPPLRNADLAAHGLFSLENQMFMSDSEQQFMSQFSNQFNGSQPNLDANSLLNYHYNEKDIFGMSSLSNNYEQNILGDANHNGVQNLSLSHELQNVQDELEVQENLQELPQNLSTMPQNLMDLSHNLPNLSDNLNALPQNLAGNAQMVNLSHNSLTNMFTPMAHNHSTSLHNQVAAAPQNLSAFSQSMNSSTLSSEQSLSLTCSRLLNNGIANLTNLSNQNLIDNDQILPKNLVSSSNSVCLPENLSTIANSNSSSLPIPLLSDKSSLAVAQNLLNLTQSLNSAGSNCSLYHNLDLEENEFGNATDSLPHSSMHHMPLVHDLSISHNSTSNDNINISAPISEDVLQPQNLSQKNLSFLSQPENLTMPQNLSCSNNASDSVRPPVSCISQPQNLSISNNHLAQNNLPGKLLREQSLSCSGGNVHGPENLSYHAATNLVAGIQDNSMPENRNGNLNMSLNRNTTQFNSANAMNSQNTQLKPMTNAYSQINIDNCNHNQPAINYLMHENYSQTMLQQHHRASGNANNLMNSGKFSMPENLCHPSNLIQDLSCHSKNYPVQQQQNTPENLSRPTEVEPQNLSLPIQSQNQSTSLQNQAAPQNLSSHNTKTHASFNNHNIVQQFSMTQPQNLSHNADKPHQIYNDHDMVHPFPMAQPQNLSLPQTAWCSKFGNLL